jgi:putative SOS response-associated peptidase YedK
MCGRFVIHSLPEDILEHLDGDLSGIDIPSNYNVAPSQPVFAIIQDEKGWELVQLNWGLVPFWAKDISIGSRMINARIETIAEKPTFKAALKRRRCLIPANGFYEWMGQKGRKQPYYLTLPSGKPFAFAGLWETWKSKGPISDKTTYKSCTIITTDASDSVRSIHNRMPIILRSVAYKDWLNPNIQDPNELVAILKSQHIEKFKNYPVSKLVNHVKNNKPDCIDPLAEHELNNEQD